jgi:hypothetical protein
MVKELIANKKLSKSAGEELLSKVNGAYSSLVGGSKEFFKKQAKQEVNDMVVEAKRQVQSYVDNKIYSTGLKMLQDGFVSPQLLENKTECGLLTGGHENDQNNPHHCILCGKSIERDNLQVWDKCASEDEF